MPFGARLQDEQVERYTKAYILAAAIVFFFLILIVRLVFVQIVDAEVNIRLSRRNSMRLRIIEPPRGRIFDRNGKVLARNRPSYSICVLPYMIRDREALVNTLCKIKDSNGEAVFDSAEVSEKIRAAYRRRFDATRIKEDVSIEVVSIVEEHSMELPGIIVETESRREYTLGPRAFHVLGYMGEIPDEQFRVLREQGYYWGDLIGRSGVEREYESLMRGTAGREYLEVNAYGKSLGTIGDMPRINAIPGHDLYLTLDARLQKMAAEAFPDSLKGAVVAIDPRNGEVLTMFSNPSIDANIFSMASSHRSQSWRAIIMDPDLPLNNRAIAGTYPPGSTFKLVSGLAGLVHEKITRDSRMPTSCHGAYRIGNRTARCWNRSGHGAVNFISAMQQSCNVYFYQLGRMLGDVAINEFAQMFTLGTLTGIDINGEKRGWLSGRELYNIRNRNNEFSWQAGMVLDHAIGQTQIFTPLQLALMVGGMSNGELIYQPHLFKEERSNGIMINQRRPQVLNTLDLDEQAIRVVQESMLSVVEPGGTGTRSAVPGIPVGGKTGSAQNPHGENTHALYVASAPVSDPVIVIAVVVENAGGGGAVAAPVAGEVLRFFFAETEEGQRTVREYEEREKEGRFEIRTLPISQ
ncbi:penicillin-binding protein 2 [Chitinispirillales bacterium ANBcel5]|uniref:penicillin-binding protein 2 n=1 Tax=Cellulosispirillum alkaliphilum TaxID=3039283 RepID=UPI002A523FC9|nr:penicillin-binding protein 2 [Chitinispirillales bacterium ANBcel5]